MSNREDCLDPFLNSKHGNLRKRCIDNISNQDKCLREVCSKRWVAILNFFVPFESCDLSTIWR